MDASEKQAALVGLRMAGVTGNAPYGAGGLGPATGNSGQWPLNTSGQIAHQTPAVAKLRFSVRTVVNGYIIEYAETEGQIAQEIVCKTLEELSAEVVRIVAANKLAGK